MLVEWINYSAEESTKDFYSLSAIAYMTWASAPSLTALLSSLPSPCFFSYISLLAAPWKCQAKQPLHQGLCTCWSFSLEYSFLKYLHSSLSQFLWVLAPMSPYHGSLPQLFYKKITPIPPCTSILSFLSLIIFPYSTYCHLTNTYYLYVFSCLSAPTKM